MSAAVEDDIRVGSTSTRVVDFVNRGPLFDLMAHLPSQRIIDRRAGQALPTDR
jgi:hypothetical protein